MTALAWFRHYGLRACVSAVATFAGAALVLFHLWLFAGRLRDLSITEPQVLVSWLGAAALGAIALFLRKRNLPLLRGKSGFVFWALVLLLHLGFTPGSPALRGELSNASLETLLALAATLALLFGTRPALSASRKTATAAPLAPFALATAGPLRAPRPPPAR